MADYDEARVSTSAQFWLPSSSETSGGVVEVDGEAVVLQVSPGLLSSIDFVEPEPGLQVMQGRNPAADDMTILLRAPMRPADATIWHGRSTSEKHAFVGSSSVGEGQIIAASVLIAGSHLPDPETAFSRAQIDATNLADWAGMPSTRMEVGTGSLRARWSLEPPDPVEESLEGTAGTLRLHSTFSCGAPTMQGFKVETGVRATLAVEGGLSLMQVRRQFLRPMVDLMELLGGDRCEILHLGLEHDGVWLNVRGQGVVVDAPRKSGQLLMTRTEMGLETAAAWLDLHARVSPAAQIVASAWSGDFPTVDVELLTLATAAEGLHRSLYPDERRFTEAELEEACVGIEGLDLPPTLAASMKTAKEWWGEVSFPSRIQALAERVAVAAPDCVGRTNRYKKAVTDARNVLAHGRSSRGMSDTELLKLASLSRSLRWMLTIRMLLEAGVSSEAMQLALARSDRYRWDRDFWSDQHPKVFGE